MDHVHANSYIFPDREAAELVRPEAAIFDFDFTLADSSAPIAECVSCALVQLGFPAPHADRVAGTIGLSLPQTFRHFTGQDDAELVNRFVQLFHARADQIMDLQTRIYDSVQAVMRSIRDAHIRTAIVTTKLNYRIRNILAANQMQEFFDVIVGANDVTNPKPHPEGLLKALKQLQTGPADAVYIGDHVIDAEAARSAGIRFIAALTGRHTRAAFEGVPHVAILESIRDLPSTLGLDRVGDGS